MPQLSRFYFNGPLVEQTTVSLDSDNAKHIWQVLRMESGDKIILTDGKGTDAEGTIHSAERHQCNVSIERVTFIPRRGQVLHLCVCFTKNNSRNEWLLEKATELGVASVFPITATRSEKTHVRHDRWQKILQSATLQSQQSYLPDLAEIMPLRKILKHFSSDMQKFIAHCIPGQERSPLIEMLKQEGESVLLIGPEGDFTEEEVILCRASGFVPVSLGHQRLRTETAAIAAAACFNLFNDGKN